MVSLRPPTKPSALRRILSLKNAQVRFLGKELHSKIYAFSRGNEDSWRDDDFECRTAVGSSNMTQGGFDRNIETNVLLDGALAKEAMLQARHIFENAYELTSDVLDRYSEEYNDHPESLFPEIYESPVKLSKEYERIVGAVKHVAELCQDMIETNFPEVPRFLVVDHFWDYLIVTRKSDRDDIKERAHSSNNSDALIRELFTDYIQHECKNENRYPDEMNIRSKELVKYLNKQSLSNDDRKALFLTFHASRYYDDRYTNKAKEFVEKNTSKQVLESLQFLADESIDISERISALQKKPLKLYGLGASAIKEFNGWRYPTKYPIWNTKSERALEILGFG
ncbi:phospholipase D-like domain-containing protein [Vibrio sp. M60_M31a]